MKLARLFRALLNSGEFEKRAALVRSAVPGILWYRIGIASLKKLTRIPRPRRRVTRPCESKALLVAVKDFVDLS